MKLSFLSENVQKKISFINKAISSKSQLPILQNFLLEAIEGKFKISATDLEIGIQIQIPAKIEKEGKTTIPAKIFSELITSLPSEKISLTLENNVLEVISNKTKSIFQTTTADEFPKIYEEKGEKIIVLKNKTIKNDFSSVIFAASTDSERPALSGILIKIKNQGLSLVATDGFRLSLREQGGKQDQEKSILVPARLLREVITMVQDKEDVDFYISKENNQVLFSRDDFVLVGRLIEADFPNYKKIIPTEFGTKAVFDKEEMQKAIKICSIFARETANIIKFSIKKEKIIVSANTPSVGQNSVEVETKTTGEENEIAFNARYLLDFFSNIEEQEIIFEMTGSLNPGVFKLTNDNFFLHLIMPIRVQS